MPCSDIRARPSDGHTRAQTEDITRPAPCIQAYVPRAPKQLGAPCRPLRFCRAQAESVFMSSRIRHQEGSAFALRHVWQAVFLPFPAKNRDATPLRLLLLLPIERSLPHAVFGSKTLRRTALPFASAGPRCLSPPPDRAAFRLRRAALPFASAGPRCLWPPLGCAAFGLRRPCPCVQPRHLNMRAILFPHSNAP